MAKTKTAKPVRPQAQLNAVLQRRCTSLGDYERLAGVDTRNRAERLARQQVLTFAAADAAITNAVSLWGPAQVGRPITSAQWINIHFAHLEASEAARAAARIAPQEWVKAHYIAEAADMAGAAEAAWGHV